MLLSDVQFLITSAHEGMSIPESDVLDKGNIGQLFSMLKVARRNHGKTTTDFHDMR
jgi:hypothetical protein